MNVFVVIRQGAQALVGDVRLLLGLEAGVGVELHLEELAALGKPQWHLARETGEA